ncbi:unnamed protein product, partial [Oikopleura dioica]
GKVKCKNGVFTSKLSNFENACDVVNCDASDAYDEFPIGVGTWNCKTKNGKLTCKGSCGISPRRDQIRFQAKCDPTRGWFIHKPQYADDFCTPEPIVDTIQSGLNLCSAAQNFPGSSSRNVESSKIVGGIDADNNAWPFIVRLKINNLYICGGVVVHNHWVLTAAHCCQDSANEIKAGLKIRTIAKNCEAKRIRNLEKISDGTASNQDWCMVRFNQDIIANDPDSLVAMPCLPTENPIPSQHGAACWLAGWGATSSSGSLSNELQSVGVNILGPEYCIEKGYKTELEEDDVCAGVPDFDDDGNADGGKDACQGDSGGPLICPINGKATLVAIVSRGVGCAWAGFPGVNANTFIAKQWMEDIIRNN